MEALEDIAKELTKAEAKFPSFNSYHEGYAVILEELDELWDEVKEKRQIRDNLYSEAAQVAAMALRFMLLVKEKGL